MKKKNFKNKEALQPICDLINEATEGLNDSMRVIANCSIPDALMIFLKSENKKIIPIMATNTIKSITGFTTINPSPALGIINKSLGVRGLSGVAILATPVGGLVRGVGGSLLFKY